MQHHTVNILAPAQGLVEFTSQLQQVLSAHPLPEGLMHLYLRHTSASLIIQENADPAVSRDLETYLQRLVPEDDSRYTHTQEGPDDMPAHIKGALTATSLSIPVRDGRLALGTWQGVFLWEHRRRPRERQVLVTLVGGS
ncbi:MAG: secondary thiamine-phosphate synthase enzyme YjbQ [Pseudomonadales bacterium]